MGYRQVVRHGILVPVFVGSNPTAPVITTIYRRNGKVIMTSKELDDQLEAHRHEEHKKIPYVRSVIGDAAMFEQLAEECSELAQAAQKAARKLRGDNPTPKSRAEIGEALIEEYTDVTICAEELGLKADPVIAAKKYIRWQQRIRTMNKYGGHEHE